MKFKSYIIIISICAFISSVFASEKCALLNSDYASAFPVINAVSNSKNLYVAVGDVGSILVSHDAKEWELIQNNEIEYQNLNDITFANNKFIAVGSGGLILTSTNGRDWIIVRKGKTNINEVLERISWVKNKYISIGSSGILTSSDGAKWMYQVTPKNLRQRFLLNILSHNNDIIIASGLNYWVSHDAVTWSNKNSGVFLNDIIWDGNNFISVHDNIVSQSNDGIEWEMINNQMQSKKLNSIAYNNNQYVIVGDCGLILTGNELSEFAEVHSGTNMDLVNVYWSGEKFVSIGSYQEVTDDVEKNIDNDVSKQIHRKGKFGKTGSVILTSEDGINWAIARIMH